MNEVLEEACRKAGVSDSSYFTLRHGKSAVDLSLPFRLSRLSPGAKVDLIRLPSVQEGSSGAVSAGGRSGVVAAAKVNVALNVALAPRRTAHVAASDSLWQVLEIFDEQMSGDAAADESAHHGRVLSHASVRSDGLVYRDQCVVQLNHKEYATDEVLKSTTLSSLGIKNGSAVIRVSFKQTDALMGAEGVQRIDRVPITTLPAEKVELPTTTGDDERPPNIDRATETSRQDTSTSELTPILQTRDIQVLIPSASTAPYHATPQAHEAEDSGLSLDQARSYHASLLNRSQVSSGPLLTQKLRERQAAEKRLASRPDTCRVKFRFSDGTQVIGSFKPTEVAGDLYDFVASVLRDPSVPFTLTVLGENQKVERNGSGRGSGSEIWRDLGFGSGVTVQVAATTDVQPRLRDEYRAMGRDASEAVAAAAAAEDESGTTATLASRANGTLEHAGKRESEASAAAGTKEKKIPKWLQKTLGKK